MDTFTISYRVADFLKKHPPFQAIEDGDLLRSPRGGVSGFMKRTNTSCGKGNRTSFMCS